MSPPTDATTTFRRPGGRRGRARLTTLLVAAEALVVDGDVDAITLDAVAERASLPLSTVRAQADDVRALFDQLVLRLLDRHDAVLNRALPTEPEPLVEVAAGVYDTYVAHYRAVPAFRALRCSSRFTDRHREWFDRRVRRMLIRVQSRTVPTNLTVEQLRIPWTVADAMLEAAFRHEPDGDPVLIDEGRALVRNSVERLVTAPAAV